MCFYLFTYLFFSKNTSDLQTLYVKLSFTTENCVVFPLQLFFQNYLFKHAICAFRQLVQLPGCKFTVFN